MLQSCSLFADTSHALNSPTPAVSYMQPGEIHFPKSPPSALHTPLIHRHNLHSALLCQTQHYYELQRFAGKRGHLKLYRLNAKLIVYKELYYNSCVRQKTYLCNRARNRLWFSHALAEHFTYLAVSPSHPGNKTDIGI